MTSQQDTELDKVLYKIGTEINKVYSSDPLNPWCTRHYFKLIDGVCVGCEAIQALTSWKDKEVIKARIQELKWVNTDVVKYLCRADKVAAYNDIDKRLFSLQSQGGE